MLTFKEQVEALMEPFEDPAYEEQVNYKVPQFLVGINNLSPDAWSSLKLVNETAIRYVINVEMPDATVSELGNASPSMRRSCRFLFYGSPYNAGWDESIFRLTFKSAIEENDDYTYERNWGGSAESIIVLEFEQIDLPTGERVWCPKEVG